MAKTAKKRAVRATRAALDARNLALTVALINVRAENDRLRRARDSQNKRRRAAVAAVLRLLDAIERAQGLLNGFLEWPPRGRGSSQWCQYADRAGHEAEMVLAKALAAR